MYSLAPQIMIEKEAIIDSMTRIQKRERKLEQSSPTSLSPTAAERGGWQFLVTLAPTTESEECGPDQVRTCSTGRG